LLARLPWGYWLIALAAVLLHSLSALTAAEPQQRFERKTLSLEYPGLKAMHRIDACNREPGRRSTPTTPITVGKINRRLINVAIGPTAVRPVWHALDPTPLTLS
jgi:hypothetical protein